MGRVGPPLQLSGVLEPAGPAARAIAELTWVMLVISAIVSIIVVVLAVYAVRHRGRRRAEADAPGGADASETADRTATRWILIGGIVIPTIVLAGVYAHSLWVLRQIGLKEPELAIEVVGKRWWWEVRYLAPDSAEAFRTANEIHIPVGRDVRLLLVSPDVIHSFWVPRLAGKIDLIPGHPNMMWLRADRPGVYQGWCAEYCGLQHAHMKLLVVAHPPDEFDAWVARQRLPATPPRGELAELGQRVFFSEGCGVCHTVRGTEASGDMGPELTHVGSQLTLAAVTIPNTPGHMSGWIANPQEVKPGAFMPWIPLSGLELRAVVAYLQGLR